MSVDTVFQPKGKGVVINNTGGQVIAPGTGPSGMVSYRVVNLSTTAATFFRLGYGATLADAIANSAAAGFSFNMVANSVETFELPATIFFAAATANTTGFEITPGQGA